MELWDEMFTRFKDAKGRRALIKSRQNYYGKNTDEDHMNGKKSEEG